MKQADISAACGDALSDDCGNVPTELVIFGEQIGAPKGAARGMTEAEIAAAAEYKARMLAQDPNYDPSLDW